MIPLSLALALALLAACGYQAPSSAVPPPQRTAFCGSTCWNNSNCIGQGFACERCVSGLCAGSSQLASALEP